MLGGCLLSSKRLSVFSIGPSDRQMGVAQIRVLGRDSNRQREVACVVLAEGDSNEVAAERRGHLTADREPCRPGKRTPENLYSMGHLGATTYLDEGTSSPEQKFCARIVIVDQSCLGPVMVGCKDLLGSAWKGPQVADCLRTDFIRQGNLASA